MPPTGVEATSGHNGTEASTPLLLVGGEHFTPKRSGSRHLEESRGRSFGLGNGDLAELALRQGGSFGHGAVQRGRCATKQAGWVKSKNSGS